MRRNGILTAIEEKYLPLGVTDDNVRVPRSVSLQKTLPVFIILMSGVFVSVACLLIEVQVHRQCCVSSNRSASAQTVLRVF
jgi:hypothetical protein